MVQKINDQRDLAPRVAGYSSLVRLLLGYSTVRDFIEAAYCRQVATLPDRPQSFALPDGTVPCEPSQSWRCGVTESRPRRNVSEPVAADNRVEL